jgi:hypothetical protein
MLEQVNPEQDRPDSADGNLDVRDVSGLFLMKIWELTLQQVLRMKKGKMTT